MRIIAQPGLGSKKNNPYNYLLYTSLINQGVKVYDAPTAKALLDSDVVHFHWPESFLNHEDAKTACLKGMIFFSKICVFLILRKRIFWTVHNLRPHERRYPWATSFFYRFFPAICNGFIFLSEATRDRARELIPAIKLEKSEVVPHGHYKDSYRQLLSKKEAREKLGIQPQDGPVVLHFGVVRRYKNVPLLVQVFRKLRGENCRLHVAGGVLNDSKLEAEIREVAAGDARINLSLRFHSDLELMTVIRAADVVVLPYADIANSGSAIMALSLERPVIAPRKGALQELQKLVGSEWIYLYDEEFSEGVLKAGCEAALTLGEDKVPDLSALDWPFLAEKTRHFFERKM